MMYSIVLTSLRLIQPPENNKSVYRLAEKISVLKIFLTGHVIIYHFTELGGEQSGTLQLALRVLSRVFTVRLG